MKRLSKKKVFSYKLIFRGKEIDIKSTIKLLYDKYALRGLPIKESEHLLYGDLNISKAITGKYAALGQIIYEDGLNYFLMLRNMRK